MADAISYIWYVANDTTLNVMAPEWEIAEVWIIVLTMENKDLINVEQLPGIVCRARGVLTTKASAMLF